jgi:hypothetical protein
MQPAKNGAKRKSTPLHHFTHFSIRDASLVKNTDTL